MFLGDAPKTPNIIARSNKHQRRIPFKDNENPPALVARTLSRSSRRKVALWYLNTIKMKPESKPKQLRLKQLLEQYELEYEELDELEEILQSI